MRYQQFLSSDVIRNISLRVACDQDLQMISDFKFPIIQCDILIVIF